MSVFPVVNDVVFNVLRLAFNYFLSLFFFSFLSLLSPFLPYNVLFPYILPTYSISDTQMANIFRFPSYPESWLCINVKKKKTTTLQSVRMIFNMPCLVPTT